MAHRRFVNTAVLCVLAFFIAFILHRPTDGGRVLYQNSSETIHKSTVLPADNRRVSTPFNGHDTLPHVNPGNDLRPRVDTPKKSEAFTTAVQSGNSLLCMMRMNKEEAAAWALASPKWATRYPVAGSFTDPSDLENWGWDPSLDGDPYEEGSIKTELIGYMDQLGLNPQVWSEWLLVAHVHASEYEVNGEAIEGAEYSSFMNKDKNNIAMVVDNMFSPKSVVDDPSSRYHGPAPDLARPSDVWFLQYYLHGQTFFNFPKPVDTSTIPAPKHIFIQNVVTPGVVKLFEETFKRLDLEVEDEATNGELFDADSEEGMMVIGTVHGSAVSMFLIQHKDFFGDLVIWNVRVWNFQPMYGLPRWDLYFEIGRADGVDEDAGAVGVGRRWEDSVRAKL
ncbi:hypothetical protein BLS_004333 [Venturia inaequalis]|uniref:Uncharacterized protein n=1 Tax=Venturia inaequalis TaxID=5025 RepID=A0A8H3UK36_VENIN|nr:hypothetical protein BLS_004333 [Venturia inaequalis]KAE9976630.1 hypothetical protein EG328_002528 [Venturia inaequalis]